jgi:hypothetical protein
MFWVSVGELLASCGGIPYMLQHGNLRPSKTPSRWDGVSVMTRVGSLAAKTRCFDRKNLDSGAREGELCKPLNRSNLNLSITTAQFRKTDVELGLFSAFYILCQVLRIFKVLGKGLKILVF